MLGVFHNRDNWRNAFNIFRYICNPITFMLYLLYPVGNPVLRVRTPTGNVFLRLRNRESAKTVFSVFCRHDYLSQNNEAFYLDLGSNIGISAAYLLSRNKENRILCVEPDPNNIPFLKQNLQQFGARADYKPHAVHTKTGSIDFFCSPDGKYSSIIPNEVQYSWEKIQVPCVPLAMIFEEAVKEAGQLPIIVKIDVEGMEQELVISVDFSEFPAIKRMIIESTMCSQLIKRGHNRMIRNGYVEDLIFD